MQLELWQEIRGMAVSDSAERRVRSRRGHPWLAELLFALDELLRRRQAVFEYTDSPSCVFRLGISHCRRPLCLRDGTRVSPGQRIAQLHFWTEQVPPLPGGATIGWARHMRRAIADSLRELARYLASRPDLNDVVVICAVVPSGTTARREQLARIMGRYGFEAIAEPEKAAIRERLHRFGENILISLVLLAHNPGALRLDTLKRVRLPVYLSRPVLEERFGGAGRNAQSAVKAS